MEKFNVLLYQHKPKKEYTYVSLNVWFHQLWRRSFYLFVRTNRWVQ